MTEKVHKKLEAVSLSEANEVKMEARSEIYMKFHVKYGFAGSRHDCVRHPSGLDCHPGVPGSNPCRSEKKSFFLKFVTKGGKFEIL